MINMNKEIKNIKDLLKIIDPSKEVFSETIKKIEQKEQDSN